MLINYKAIKYFNNKIFKVERYNKVLKAYEDTSIKVIMLLAFLNIGQNVIFFNILIGMMYLAINGVTSGELIISDLIIIN